MSSYESFSPPKRSNKWLLWSLIFIFLITLTTFTILEVRSLSDEEPSVIRIIMNRINVPQEESHKFVLVNAKNVPQERDELVRAIVRQVEENPQAVELERKTRDTEEIPKQSPVALEHHKNNNSYYEEQTPVVVYSKTDPDPPLSYRQNAPPVPYGSHEEEPYYDGEDNGEYANDNDAFYRPQYDDDSREDFSPPQNYANADDESEGRSSQTRQYDNYYRQWHYATPSPPTSSLQKSNRKLQTMTEDPREPYPLYGDDYDYMGAPQQSSGPASQHKYQQQQLQSYRPQSSSSHNQAVANQQQEGGHEMNFLTVLKTLKTMWDLYQSFIAAWNTMAEKHNKQEELAQQKLKQKQQELRINSKKPPKIESKKKPENSNKNPKANSKQAAKGSTTSTTTEVSISTEEEEEEQRVATTKPQQLRKAKDEPRKGTKGDRSFPADVEGLRKRRAAAEEDSGTAGASTTDVGEGRYIKGDPLKGYYDFVITEGSYKFWAAFQVGTALLIIYSTFAAIYYSKVNPLVSDYDYTDYLGGARSLSGGDLDFVDDETAEGSQQRHSQGWFDWLPRTGHSLKFILDAIDKLPVDHDGTDGSSASDALSDENLNVTEDLNESRSNNEAM